MMTFTKQCLSWALLGFLAAGHVETTDFAVYEVIRSNFDFANDLYSTISKQNASSNVFFSPLSIHTILALAFVGAGGKTAQEMAAGLRLSNNVDVVKKGFQQLLQGINNNTESITIEIANKIFLGQNSHVSDDFNSLATQYFQSEVQNVDFGAEEETVNMINEWAENKTEHKIHDIIGKYGLDSLTKCILVNAVYFKGAWETPFKTYKTSSKPFYVTATNTKMVDMMFIEESFVLRRNKNIEADILELPYKGDTMSLVVILPFTVDGLQKTENMLRSINLRRIFDSLRIRQQHIAVFLPKFKIKNSLKLNKYLMALGMNSMLENNANFSAISNSGLSVNDVLHSAFIDVNEEGTEAAAATAHVDALLSGRMKAEPVVFNADHPFLFILRSKTTEAILFMGRFVIPE